MLRADVPISTAINNSARFPFLDPSGEIDPRPTFSIASPLDQISPDGMRRDIIDGGYFDNSGLQTALDLARWLHEQGPAALGQPARAIDPIIVLADADGDVLPAERVVRCEAATDDPDPLRPTPRPLQALVPFDGILAQRGAHAAILINEARTDYCADATPPVYRCDAPSGLPVRCTTATGAGQRFFHFYLPANGNRPIPLNWVLSDTMARFIWNEAMKEAANPREDWIMRQALASTSDPRAVRTVVAAP
jgi:hypothetical protein